MKNLKNFFVFFFFCIEYLEIKDIHTLEWFWVWYRSACKISIFIWLIITPSLIRVIDFIPDCFFRLICVLLCIFFLVYSSHIHSKNWSKQKKSILEYEKRRRTDAVN